VHNKITHSVPQLSIDKRLENRKRHVEYVGIVDDENTFESQWNALLKPFETHRSE
jgi:hypothetical protein